MNQNICVILRAYLRGGGGLGGSTPPPKFSDFLEK